MHISQVKPEFRSIGITVHRINHETFVVGVVYRGNRIIEGVLSSRTRSGLVDAISEMLTGSKHYGQIRLILMDETMLPGPLPVETLWQRTEKPVLLFTENDEAFDPRYFFRYNKRLVQAAGIDEDSARRVLDKITCKTSVESLRIAGIILKNIAQLHNV